MKISLSVFRGVIANVVIVVVVAAIAFVGFSGNAAAVSEVGGAVYRGGASDKVCLMFNVYGGTEYLGEILETLDEHEVKTTFFVGGCWVKSHEAELNEIAERGHEIGNHGFFHRDHAKLDAAKNGEEIVACHNIVKAVTGKEMKLFAPPSGSYSSVTLDIAAKKGYTTVMWSKDTVDWRDKDCGLIYTRATKNVSGGELILMHPTAATAEVLCKVLCTLRENGLTATTVGDVLGLNGDKI